MIREFRLSPAGSGLGVSCDANGAFVGSVPLLKCEGETGCHNWAPRAIDELSEELGSEWSLPVDMSSKAGGLKAISRALNDGDIARAQIAAVLLGIPDAPNLAKSNRPRDELIKFIRNLFQSNLIKADWDSDEHPRWPAGSSDSQGGRFAPKGGDSTGPAATAGGTDYMGQPPKNQTSDNSLLPVAANSRDDISRNPPGRKSEEECMRQYDSDLYVCGSLRDKRDYVSCKRSAGDRLGACLAGKRLPPLTLPEPDYDFHALPSNPSRNHWPSKPPAWLPLLFLPWALPAFGL